MDPSKTKQKQQASAMVAALPEELVEEVLLRFPPDDPASLVRAALASKPWCRLVCEHGFRRRFWEFHGTPPLLGFLCLRDRTAQDRLFVPTSSFTPHHYGDLRDKEAVHSCHGRVLLQSTPTPWPPRPEHLFVWDPIADKLRQLPRRPLYLPYSCGEGNAAVLCAGAVGDGCNHLDCHLGPFLVVFVGADRNRRTFTCVYSSDADRWSDPVYAEDHCDFEKGNSVLIGSAVYFKCRLLSTGEPAILKYDLLTQESSMIHIPLDGVLRRHFNQQAMLIVMEGRLGFAFSQFSFEKSKLHLWSREHGPDEDARWAQSRVIDLDKLLQTELRWTNVVGFADTGAGGVIFIWSHNDDRLFYLNLKSGRTKVVRESFGISRAIPYMSFCTPAPGSTFTKGRTKCRCIECVKNSSSF